MPGGLVGLIDAANQLQKHLESLIPVVDEEYLNPPLENWFEDEEGGPTETDPAAAELTECYPEAIEAAERVREVLQEESSYILRQAASALNKAKMSS